MASIPEDEVFRVFTAPMGCENRNRGTRIVEREGWYQLITPGSKKPSRNIVLFSSVADSDAEAVIDETIAQYRAIDVPIRWCVGPPTRPFDFGDRLTRRGFVATDMRGMACEPARFGASEVPDVVVQRIGVEDADVYADTMVTGWHTGHTPPSADEFVMAREDQRWTFSQPGERFQSFLARYRGQPAGTAGFILKRDMAYLVGGNVLPALRQRGIYRALVAARMARLCELGIPYAATHASESTSAPILEKLGFTSVYRGKVYTLV
jgi:GNAT superfamily N-acetyltransferase